MALALLVLGMTLAQPARAAVYWADGWTGAIGRANLDGSDVDPSFVIASSPYGVAVDSGHLYWNVHGYPYGIGRSDANGTLIEPRFIVPPSYAQSSDRGVAVDGRYLYWSQYGGTSGGKIGRAGLDGSALELNFIVDQWGPCGIAVDDAHLYWGNVNAGTIGRSDLDGSHVDPTFISLTSGFAPCGVAVDASHIYWATWHNGGSTIGRADLDGQDVDEDFITGAITPCGVAVDASHVYWANQFGPNGVAGSIGRADLDGSNVDQTFISSKALDRPCGVAVDALRPATMTTSISKSHVVYGEQLAVTASVTGAGDPPEGDVRFTRNGDDAADVPLDDGQAIYEPAFPLDVGDRLSARYLGDDTHVSQRADRVGPTVEPASTATRVTVAPNPAGVGAAITLTVTVSNSQTSAIPFGSVLLQVDGDPLDAPLELDDNGRVTGELAGADLRAGRHLIAATYRDDTVDWPGFEDFVQSRGETTLTVQSPQPLAQSPPGALPAAAPPQDRLRPRLSAVTLAPSRLRPGRRIRLSFTTSEPATISLRISRLLPGRRRGKVCLPPRARSPKTPHPCIRSVIVRTSRRPARTGRNTMTISTQGLPVGRYRVTVAATDAAGNASPVTSQSFTVVRAPPR